MNIALGGSMLASAVTLTIATQVIASGRAIDGVLLRHAASGIVLGYSVTPLSAWLRLLAYSTIENAGTVVLGLGAGMVALAHGLGALRAPTWACGGELTARTFCTCSSSPC